ncbi:MAG: hypothetical protein KH235_12510, partial [Oscillospiraceae bacterium]|nr:hypothetical protein [Oscillospiraceae bacterium]
VKILSRSFSAEILVLQGFPVRLRDSCFFRDNSDYPEIQDNQSFIMGGLHAFLAVPAGGGVYSVLYVDDFCFPQLHPVGLVRRQLLRHLGNFECPDDI